MLRSIRKFSTSIYAKILMGIIIIPFVFWGMGSNFKGGSKNVVVIIDKEKYTVQEFATFIEKIAPFKKKINPEQIEELLLIFIGEKLIEKEVEHYAIKLSDDSLVKLLKNQKDFSRGNQFSRIEYEKFLLKNNITASIFEENLSKVEKKKQLLDFIGEGMLPPKFIINEDYNKINQKRHVQLIDLSKIFIKKINFSENQINAYYKDNIEKYSEIYKSMKLIELNPKKLIGSEKYSDLFFKKVDEIDDLIAQGRNLDFITKKFNLENTNEFTINNYGVELNSGSIDNIPKDLVKNIFNVSDEEPTVLIENNEKYFIIEVFKTDNIQGKITDKKVRNDVLLNLEKATKRELISKIISRINKNNFSKSDFDKLSMDENVPINKISLNNANDDKMLKKELVNQIYKFSEKKVIVVNDIEFQENYLIYIDKIDNVKISENSVDYKKYSNLSKVRMKSILFNTYDNYIKRRYEIDINYKTLDTVKNYFN